jgi:hypothetical protein
MARHIIAANVRGFRFALRADWSDPDCEIEIDASASVDAPDGMEWQETGDTVGHSDTGGIPQTLIDDGVAIDMTPDEVGAAANHLFWQVNAHFDDWEADDLTPAAVYATAAVSIEREDD